jgi:hypothetical protein
MKNSIGHRTTVGEQLPVSLEGLSLGMRTPLSLRAESTSFAYLLGAFLAHTEVGTKASAWVSFAADRKEKLLTIAHHLHVCFEHSPEIHPIRIHEKDLFRLTVSSPALSRHLHSITSDNRQVPWEHLETEEEHRSFLRGVFDQGGWISRGSSPGIGIGKVYGYDLLRDLARVSVHVGMYPLLSSERLATLRFRERRDWLVFESTVGFSSRSDSEKLTELCLMRATKRSFEIYHYEAAFRLARETTLSYSQIAESIGVPVCSVRDWLKGRGTPSIVKRAHALEAHVSDLPDEGVISLLYRHLHCSSDTARRCAAKLAASDVANRIERSPELFSRARGDDAAVSKLLGL